jgi:Holliday junction resolvasome RuvABC endonuclease subunit
MTIFIALDPAHSTGYALAKVDGTHCDIYEYGFIDVDNSSPYIGDWAIDLQSNIQKIYDRVKFTDVAVEAFFFSSRFTLGTDVNPAYRTAIHIWARQNKLPYSILNISNWKTIAAGRSTPTKEQKLKYGKDAAKKIMIVQALWERHGIRLPNHSISPLTGKPVIFRYDIADAIGQAIYHAHEKYNCRSFSCSVPVQPDVAFSKTSKKHFSYDDPCINPLEPKQENEDVKRKSKSRKSRTSTL